MSSTHQDPKADGDTAGGGPPELDGYRMGRRLGTGGSASVWLATSDHDGHQYAAKVFGSGSMTAEQLRREVQLLQRLDHEHLVRLHEVVQSGQGSALVMDYAAGDSLSALISARGPMPVEEVVTILTPVARCLAYLHSHGVTHSDVAPGNVVFTAHGKPLLTDLGLGRRTGESGAANAGTAGFAAADTAETPDGQLRPEDDIRGLAAVGWYALTGRIPAADDRRPPLPVVVPTVPEDLALIIEAGLQSSPGLRPSATEFEQAVFHSAHAAPVNLVPSVHESVLPHLLTRRNVIEQERPAGRIRRIMARAPQPTGGGSHRMQAGKPKGSKPPGGERAGGTRRTAPGQTRSGGLKGAPGAKNRVAGASRVRRPVVGGLVVAAAVVAGALFATGGTESIRQEASGSSGSQGTAATQGPGSAPRPTSTDPPSTQRSSSTKQSVPQAPAPRSSTTSPEDAAGVLAGVPEGIRAKLASPDPGTAVRGLAWLRSYAFSSGRTEVLGRVNVPGSPAMAADRRTARQIERNGHVFAGFRTRISGVERLESPPVQQWNSAQQGDYGSSSDDGGRASVFMAVTAESGGFAEKDSQGRVVRRHRQERQRLVLELQRMDGQWFIADVLKSTRDGGDL